MLGDQKDYPDLPNDKNEDEVSPTLGAIYNEHAYLGVDQTIQAERCLFCFEKVATVTIQTCRLLSPARQKSSKPCAVVQVLFVTKRIKKSNIKKIRKISGK